MRNIAIGAVVLAVIVAAFVYGVNTPEPEPQGAAEAVGEDIDRAADQMGEEVDRAADQMGDAVEDAGDEVEQATDKAN